MVVLFVCEFICIKNSCCGGFDTKLKCNAAKNKNTKENSIKMDGVGMVPRDGVG